MVCTKEKPASEPEGFSCSGGCGRVADLLLT